MTGIASSRLSSTLRSGFHQRVASHTNRVVGNGARKITAMGGSGRFLVGGNWKCNGDTAAVTQLVKDLNAGSVPADVEVVIAPPFLYLDQVKKSIKADYKLSAQNCWIGKGGAFTGEIAAEMLSDMDIPWVILGHSERRALCGETNEIVGTKVAYALSQGIKVIACIGETLPQRESGQMFSILEGQLSQIANNVEDWTKVVIAYEPVWAIGTGVVATPEQAEEVHAWVRQWIGKTVSPAVADKIRILYGGSVNDGNCAELADLEDVDGFLVGGASLKGESFVKICNAQKAAAKA